eukprot:5158938-Amphidinium_carterae.1
MGSKQQNIARTCGESSGRNLSLVFRCGPRWRGLRAHVSCKPVFEAAKGDVPSSHTTGCYTDV